MRRSLARRKEANFFSVACTFLGFVEAWYQCAGIKDSLFLFRCTLNLPFVIQHPSIFLAKSRASTLYIWKSGSYKKRTPVWEKSFTNRFACDTSWVNERSLMHKETFFIDFAVSTVFLSQRIKIKRGHVLSRALILREYSISRRKQFWENCACSYCVISFRDGWPGRLGKNSRSLASLWKAFDGNMFMVDVFLAGLHKEFTSQLDDKLSCVRCLVTYS